MSRREPTPIAPRLLTAEQAAAYLGYATTGLLANIPVKPRKMAERGPGSQPKYDRVEIDAWLDRLAGLSVAPAGGSPTATGQTDEAEAAYETWRTTRGAG